MLRIDLPPNDTLVEEATVLFVPNGGVLVFDVFEPKVPVVVDPNEDALDNGGLPNGDGATGEAPNGAGATVGVPPNCG